MTKFRVLVAALAAVLTVGAPTPGRAEAKGAPRDVKKAAAPRKVLKLEEMKVEGRIQKPQAMFLMPRANLNVGDLDHREPLLPKISRAVEKDPF